MPFNMLFTIPGEAILDTSDLGSPVPFAIPDAAILDTSDLGEFIRIVTILIISICQAKTESSSSSVEMLPASFITSFDDSAWRKSPKNFSRSSWIN